jgi:hypothetical protein
VRPRLEGLEDRLAPAAGVYAQEAAALEGLYYQVVDQSYVLDVGLFAAGVVFSLEILQAQAEANHQANGQKNSNSSSGSNTSGTTGNSGSNSSNSSGQGKGNKGSGDNTPGDGNGNGNGGPNVPDIDNVVSRIVGGLLNNAPGPGALISGASRLVQLVFGGPGPADTPAPVHVDNIPTLRVGGSGVGSVAVEAVLGQATRLAAPADAGQANIPFVGGQRPGGIDLTPLIAGGVGVVPTYVVGGTGAAQPRAQAGPGNGLEGAPAATNGSASGKTTVTPRAAEDVPLKTYLLGPPPPAESAPPPRAEPPAANDKLPEQTSRAPSDADALDDATATAVADAVFAEGYEEWVNLPVLDVDSD